LSLSSVISISYLATWFTKTSFYSRA